MIPGYVKTNLCYKKKNPLLIPQSGNSISVRIPLLLSKSARVPSEKNSLPFEKCVLLFTTRQKKIATSLFKSNREILGEA